MDSGLLQEAYTTPEAAGIVGLKYATLDSWSRRGQFFTASIRESTGPGRRGRLYSFNDLVGLAAIVRLRASGVSLQTLRKVKRVLQGYDIEQGGWAHLVVSGDDLILTRGEDELVSVLKRPHQKVLNVLDMVDVVSDVGNEAQKVIQLRTKGADSRRTTTAKAATG